MSNELPIRACIAILALSAALVRADDATVLEVRLQAASGSERLVILEELSELHRNNLPDRSLDLAREGVGLATELDDSAAEARLRIAAASALNLLGRNDEAVAELESALEIQRQAADAADLARILRRIGAVQFDLGRYPEALDRYQESLGQAESSGDPLETAKTLANMGNLLTRMERLEEATERHRRALALFEQEGFELGVAASALNLGVVLNGRARARAAAGDPEGAGELWRQAISAHERARDQFAAIEVPRGVAKAISNLAIATEALGDVSESIALHATALDIRRAIGEPGEIANSLNNLGDLLAQTGRTSASVEHYGEALELATASGIRAAEVSARFGLARALEQLGDYRSALTHFQAAAELGDELGSLETERQLAELEARFAAEREAREIERLRLEQARRAIEVERQKAQRNLAAAVGLVVLGLAVLLYGRYRRQRRAVLELEDMSRSDPLTGLANRRALLERLSSERSRADRTGRPFAVVLGDLDRFKTVNDRYGHSAGDQVLQQVSRRLADTVREQDVVGRWGGEELMLILPETEPDGAAVLAEKIRMAVAVQPFEVEGRRVPVTLTLGVAGYTPHGDLDGTVREADRAMYAGKRAGRDRVVVADPDHRHQVVQMPDVDAPRAQRAG